MAFYCDIVGELNVRHIYSIIDSIFFYLDWTSMKNASLVSKAWRQAALVALRTMILTQGNPNWSSKQKRLWLMARTHLTFPFHIPQEDPNYTQRFANSMQLAFERMQKGCADNLLQEMTLDYLPSNLMAFCVVHLLHSHFEMNEKFIVAFDPKTQLLNFWSRRTLLPLNLDEEFRMRKYRDECCGAGVFFKLSGNFLIYGEIVSIDAESDDNQVLHLTKVDLDAKCRGIDEGALTVTSAHLRPHPNARGNSASCKICHMDVAKDLILLVLRYTNDEYYVSVLWRVEEAEAGIDLRSSNMLQIPAIDHDYYTNDCFFDANYFVAKWGECDCPSFQHCEFRSFSLHPRKPGGPIEIRFITSFTVLDAFQFEYKNGILAAASNYGTISFMDVVKGTMLKVVQTPVNLALVRSYLRLTRDYLVCSIMFDPSRDYKGTFFYVWDLQSIIHETTDQNKLICEFKALTETGRLLEFKMDELGIVIAMEGDPGVGIQVLSFVPVCNHCKRVTRPAMLKRCSRCKSAAYCSDECQAADWNPHHKLICDKLEPMDFLGTRQMP